MWSGETSPGYEQFEWPDDVMMDYEEHVRRLTLIKRHQITRRREEVALQHDGMLRARASFRRMQELQEQRTSLYFEVVVSGAGGNEALEQLKLDLLGLTTAGDGMLLRLSMAAMQFTCPAGTVLDKEKGMCVLCPYPEFTADAVECANCPDSEREVPNSRGDGCECVENFYDSFDRSTQRAFEAYCWTSKVLDDPLLDKECVSACRSSLVLCELTADRSIVSGITTSSPSRIYSG